MAALTPFLVRLTKIRSLLHVHIRPPTNRDPSCLAKPASPERQIFGPVAWKLDILSESVKEFLKNYGGLYPESPIDQDSNK